MPTPFDCLANDFLWARVLAVGPIRDAGHERQLTALRRHAVHSRGVPLGTLAHLAIQCFLNEFAWREDANETACVEALGQRIEAGDRDPATILKFACYRPLIGLTAASDVAGLRAPEPLNRVVEQQIRQLLEECRIAEGLPTLTPISPGVSEAVREMYEANPYPRWGEIGDTRPTGESGDVLIAGCGTGKHAIQVARRMPGAKVLAIDLSRASLAHGVRRARELGVGNVEFAQADILEMPGTGRTFDHIEAVGVLHHMAEPRAGLRAVASMLKPEGRLRIGLYSRIGRRPLEPAKALGATYPSTTEGIRALRQAVMDAPAGDPLKGVFPFSDFFGISTCRDLLLHVQEHLFSPTELGELLASAGLVFDGFNLSAAKRDAYTATFPDDPAASNLANWTVFEEQNPTTFKRCYQFWARKASP